MSEVKSNIKDSNALGKELGLVHTAMCIIAEHYGFDLVLCSLKDYMNNENTL